MTVRSWLESLLLHALAAGALLLLADRMAPQPSVVRLDFCLSEGTPERKGTAVTSEMQAPACPPRIPAPASKVPRAPTEASLSRTPVNPAPAPGAEAEPAAAPAKETRLSPQAGAAENSREDVYSAHSPEESTHSGAGATTDAATSAIVDGFKADRAEGEVEYRQVNYGLIRSAIQGRIRYPLLARRQAWSGRTEVSFRIGTDGRVADLRVTRSSGYPLLDEEALRAVRGAAPFPPPPVVALLVMPVSFELQ